MMRLSKTDNNFIVLMLCICISFLVVPESAAAGKPPVVRYSNGLLTVKADNAPLIKVLEEISEAADLDVYVAEDFKPDNVSIRFEDRPLEAAVKTLLKAYNHALIYKKEGGILKISELKVYLEGQTTGLLTALKENTIAGEDQTADAANKARQDTEAAPVPDMVNESDRTPGKSGLLIPNRYAGKYDTPQSETMGRRLEIQEQVAFGQINDLKNRIDLTQNEEEREALNIVLMDNLVAFEKLQRANQNKIEAMHRIELFNQNKTRTENKNTDSNINN